MTEYTRRELATLKRKLKPEILRMIYEAGVVEMPKTLSNGYRSTAITCRSHGGQNLWRCSSRSPPTRPQRGGGGKPCGR